MNEAGQLLSYSTTDPVSNEVIVCDPGVINDGQPSPDFDEPGWAGFGATFAGVNSAGQNCIFGMYGPTELQIMLSA